jgi:hypothetical protein
MLLGIVLNDDWFPSLFLEGFKTQADFAAFGVYLENLDPHFLINLDNIGGISHAIATQFRDVD